MRRSHVEMRSRDVVPPRQYVSETHDHKNSPPVRICERNKMTVPLIPLAIALGLFDAFPSLER